MATENSESFNKEELIVIIFIIIAVIGFFTFIFFPSTLPGYYDAGQKLSVVEYMYHINSPAAAFFESWNVRIGLLILTIVFSEFIFTSVRKDSKRKWGFLDSLVLKTLVFLCSISSAFAFVWYAYFSKSILGYLTSFFELVANSWFWILVIGLIVVWVVLNHLWQDNWYAAKYGVKKKRK